jgi:hypothetical protein
MAVRLCGVAVPPGSGRPPRPAVLSGRRSRAFRASGSARQRDRPSTDSRAAQWSSTGLIIQARRFESFTKPRSQDLTEVPVASRRCIRPAGHAGPRWMPLRGHPWKRCRRGLAFVPPGPATEPRQRAPAEALPGGTSMDARERPVPHLFLKYRDTQSKREQSKGGG